MNSEGRPQGQTPVIRNGIVPEPHGSANRERTMAAPLQRSTSTLCAGLPEPSAVRRFPVRRGPRSPFFQVIVARRIGAGQTNWRVLSTGRNDQAGYPTTCSGFQPSSAPAAAACYLCHHGQASQHHAVGVRLRHRRIDIKLGKSTHLCRLA